MAVGADDIETAQGRHFTELLFARAAELDVRAPTGHVGRDGHRAGGAGPGDDRGLELVALSVEHIAEDAGGFEGGSELFRFLDARRPDENGAARDVDAGDLIDQSRELGRPVSEDDVGEVAPDARPVGRDDDDAQPVEFLELAERRPGRGRHAAERRVEAEEMLERDGAEDAALGAAADALLGFDGRLEAVGPMALVHDPAGELVDDLDAAGADDVVDVPLEKGLGVEGAVGGGQEHLVFRGEKVAAAEKALDPEDAGVRGEDVGVLRVGLVVLTPLEAADDGSQAAGVGAGPSGGPRNDERDAGLVDEDRIGLVDEGGIERPVDEIRGLVGQTVTEVIEAGLFGRGAQPLALALAFLV